ncbi:hypothetical protein PspLS_03019 [Pyricularia sp. CBS 133598]|nr:hypothetical protein PspLS_03019 [Pyricularia sp. CBS 133598]
MSLDNATGIVFAAPPPPGVQPDPDKPADLNDLLVPSFISFTFVVITLGIRVYTRAFLTRALSMDDYVMVVAVLCTTVLLVAGLHSIRWGMGKDIWDVPLEPDIYPNFMLNRVISSAAFCLATGFAKGSILLFYLRIFPTRKMKYTVWILFGFTVGYSTASAFVNIFSCSPVEASWRVEYATAPRCINRGFFYYTQAALGILTDIATVVTPLPMLRSLRLPVRQKIGTGFVLTVGAFVCIISVVRFKSLFDLSDDNNLTPGDTKPAMLWCILELNLSIIGGNFPTLRPFGQSIFPRLRSSSGSACGWWSKYYGRSERRGARVRSFGAGTTIGDDYFGNAETSNVATTPAASPHRERAGRDSGERILLADREQHHDKQKQGHQDQQKEQEQEKQPRDEEAGISGTQEQTEAAPGIIKTDELGCKRSSEPVQSEP